MYISNPISIQMRHQLGNTPAFLLYPVVTESTSMSLGTSPQPPACRRINKPRFSSVCCLFEYIVPKETVNKSSLWPKRISENATWWRLQIFLHLSRLTFLLASNVSHESLKWRFWRYRETLQTEGWQFSLVQNWIWFMMFEQDQELKEGLWRLCFKLER